MRESDVVGCEVPSVHLESRIVVGRRLPIGTQRSLLEVLTTPEAVALGHLATHVDDLAISGKLPEDSANFQGLELLEWSLSIHEGQTRARTCQNLLLASMTIAVAVCATPRHWGVDGPRARWRRRESNARMISTVVLPPKNTKASLERGLR